MSHDNFIGIWAGSGHGAQFGRARIVISAVGDLLRVYGYGRTSSNEVEVFEFEGGVQSETSAVLDLIDYVTDNPNTSPPVKARLSVTYKDAPEQLEVQFATDIGTHGVFWLHRAGGPAKLMLKIPPMLHKQYRRVKLYLRSRFRYFYLAIVLILTLLSILGEIKEKISSVEALLLIVPLIFLFIDRVKGLLATLALRKVGPLEFESQAKTSAHSSPNQIVQKLQAEFGNQVPLFSAIAQWLVPRTKMILRLMAAERRPLTRSEFNKLAISLGVTESDLQPTYEALIQSGCIVVNDNAHIVVQETGNRFLIFESRVAQLYGTG